jgi:hypothetical protein
VDIQKARKDFLAGFAFVAFGLAFAIASTTYELGTALNMGPGYFPLVLGGILVFLGILVVIKGFVAGEGGDLGRVPWKAVALLVVAILFFGFTVRGLGLALALLVTTLLAALAGHRTGVVAAAIIAGGLTALCVLIFVMALQLRLPIVGTWIPV